MGAKHSRGPRCCQGLDLERVEGRLRCSILNLKLIICLIRPASVISILPKAIVCSNSDPAFRANIIR